MRIAFPVASVVAVAALLAAGCGGGSTNTAGSSAADVAGIVPASVPLLLALETDPESEQWQQAEELLDRFPGRERLLDGIREGLSEEGVDLEADVLPALGDETYVTFTDFEDGGENVVVITKPRDKAKLDELLEESDEPTVTREVEDWTLIANSEEILDAFTGSTERLEDADWFGDAQGKADEEALVTVFANGPAINEALREGLPPDCELPEEYGQLQHATATLAAADHGLRMRAAVVGEGVEDLVRGESLLSLVPAGAFAYLGSPGFDLDRFPLGDQLRCGLEGEELPDVERELGFSFDEVLELFAGGFGLYVRPGTLIPEVTLLLAPEDEARAVETLDDLAEKAAALGGEEIETRRIGDTEARELTLGPVSILYGAGDGRVSVSTAAAGIEALGGGGDLLQDDEVFGDAQDAAGVGDDDEIFAYFDLRQLVELADRLAGFADQNLPPEVNANLEPLQSFLAWGDLSDPNDVEFGAFLEIR